MRLLPLALLLVLFACDASFPIVAERTYPVPNTYPIATVPELLAGEAGRYNIEAIVLGWSRCPPDAICSAPDHFVAAEDVDMQDAQVLVRAVRPDQLRSGSHYILSIEALGEVGDDRAFTLLGWAESARLD